MCRKSENFEVAGEKEKPLSGLEIRRLIYLYHGFS